jgi:hypothetical protein
MKSIAYGWKHDKVAQKIVHCVKTRGLVKKGTTSKW